MLRNVNDSKGSGYRTACGSLNLKPYLTTSCNMTIKHDEMHRLSKNIVNECKR